MNKIAVLGGAFDPPHNAHIAIARAALQQNGYDKIIILPSVNPPHKHVVGDVCHRFNMAKLAFIGHEYEVSDLELKTGGYGYTVDTIPRLKDYLKQDFDFIVGGDSMRDFRKWYHYEDILKLVNIVVAVRDGDYDSVRSSIAYLDDLPKRGISVLEYLPQAISSSSVRLLRELGRDITQFVPKNVADYIYDNNLYSGYDVMREKLKATLSCDRYCHTLGVVEFAMQYQGKLSLPYEQVFTASILHDCAKYKLSYEGLDIPNDSINSPVAHAFAGACLAKSEYGITDSCILDAIYYHSTAKADMSTLSMLVYCADMLESGRSYNGVEELREIFARDFYQGFRACLTRSYKHLMAEHTDIYPLTHQAYEYYK